MAQGNGNAASEAAQAAQAAAAAAAAASNPSLIQHMTNFRGHETELNLSSENSSGTGTGGAAAGDHLHGKISRVFLYRNTLLQVIF